MKKEKICIIAIGLILSLLSPITQSQEVTSETRKENLTECASVSLWRVSGKSLNKGELPKKTVKVPEGWQVVGGGYDSQYSEPIMIICR